MNIVIQKTIDIIQTLNMAKKGGNKNILLKTILKILKRVGFMVDLSNYISSKLYNITILILIEEEINGIKYYKKLMVSRRNWKRQWKRNQK